MPVHTGLLTQEFKNDRLQISLKTMIQILKYTSNILFLKAGGSLSTKCVDDFAAEVLSFPFTSWNYN